MAKIKDTASVKLVLYIAFAVVIFFAVNIIGSSVFTGYKIDFTEDGAFTLSDGSVNVLKKLDEPITLRFFFSNKLISGVPAIKAYAVRIRGMLEEYESRSNGKIKLMVIDPKPFSENEDMAISYGMKGSEINKIGEKVYFGLAAGNSVDDTKVIPFFSPDQEKFLEYEITGIIFDLANQKRKRVGILSTIRMGSAPLLGIPGMGGSSWLVINKIKQLFDIIDIKSETKRISRGIDVLMVVQPRGLGRDTLYAIDQYVLRGGKAVFFVDPHKEGSGTGNPADRSFSSSFNLLLNSFGVEVNPRSVIADRNSARKYDKIKKEQWKYVDYLAWLGLGADKLSKNDVTTSGLKRINVNTAGSIESIGGSDVAVIPLILSSRNSMKIPVSKVRLQPNPNDILRNFVTDNKEYTIAARITGNISSAFGNNVNSNHISKSMGPINVVVVADTDILRDENWASTRDFKGYKIVRPHADNASFVVNILDNLSGNSDLIDLRGRGTIKRPFTVVEALKRQAESRYLTKEQELKAKLNKTEKRLEQLQKMAKMQAGNALAYKAKQQYEIKNFSKEMVRIKKDLRSVRGELQKEIEGLGRLLKFINIWLMPLIIIALAIAMFIVKRYKAKTKLS